MLIVVECFSLPHITSQVRYVMKYRHCDGNIVFKVTSDTTVRIAHLTAFSSATHADLKLFDTCFFTTPLVHLLYDCGGF